MLHQDSIIHWHGSTAWRYPAHDSYVYLLHFEQPYKHARHYLGSTGNLEARMRLHRNGNGARLMEVVSEAGISWQVSRLWRTDTREAALELERKLKRQHDGVRLCPICQHRGRDLLVQLRQGHWPIALHGAPGRRVAMGEACPHFVRREF